MPALVRPAHRSPKRSHGFLLVDVITALVLLAALGTAMVVAQSARSHAARKLADTRTAIRLAERSLSELQSGRSIPTDMPDAHVEVRRLTGDPGIPGQKWVQVRITLNGQSAVLSGLVPTQAAPTEVRP
jgi:type II secretory pathway pseudopilin PulG